MMCSAAPLNPPIAAAVLTVSDRCSRGQAEDTAGPALQRILRDELSGSIHGTACVPDEAEPIRNQLLLLSREDPSPDLILTTGGTGLGPRDITPEVTAAVIERRHPALLELARYRCYVTTPLACLSRGEAGTIRSTLVINLPGSERGATETLRALLDVLPHAVRMLRGEGHTRNDRGTGGERPGPSASEPGS